MNRFRIIIQVPFLLVEYCAKMICQTPSPSNQILQPEATDSVYTTTASPATDISSGSFPIEASPITTVGKHSHDNREQDSEESEVASLSQSRCTGQTDLDVEDHTAPSGDNEKPINGQQHSPCPQQSGCPSHLGRDFQQFFEIRPSRLGGVGAFAVRALKKDEIILVEEPLLRTTWFYLRRAFSNLSEADKNTYLNLHCDDRCCPFKKIEQIMQRNS
jgi:hypothetical protein